MDTYPVSLTIATAGHVDHGKSTLVRLLTGTDTDTLAEEKARGMTINLGFAYRGLGTAGSNPGTIAFVDVPGHQDFTANMLAGVGQAQACMLVIAADDGIMPQSREHIAILDLLGFNKGCMVITKIDRVDQRTLARRIDEVTEVAATTSLSALPVFPVSSIDGRGVDALTTYLDALALSCTSSTFDDEHNTRYSVDRCFSLAGIGTVLTGTVLNGTLRVGDQLRHSKDGARVRIRRLHHHQSEVASAFQGQRVAASVDLPAQAATRGDWLLAHGAASPTTVIDVRLRISASAELRPTSLYHLHLGPAHHIVTLRRIADSSYFRLYSTTPMVACHGDRLVLRDPAAVRTIAGGSVIDCPEPRRRTHLERRLRRLTSLDRPDAEALEALLESEPGGVDTESFSSVRNLTQAGLTALLDSLKRQQRTPLALSSTGSRHRFLGEPWLQVYETRLRSILEDYHLANPYHEGLSQSGLAARLQLAEAHELFPSLLQHWLDCALLKREGTVIALASHKAKTDPELTAFMSRIGPLLRAGGFTAPRTFELAEHLTVSPSRLERQLRAARQAGRLVRVADNRHYLPETIAELARFTESLLLQLTPETRFTVQQFRDASGIGRNLCIEILEYFDSVGFTRRDGNFRRVTQASHTLFGSLSR